MRKEEELVKAGIYGKFSHPTCTTLAVVFWMFFLFIPDLRIFISDVWMTFILFFWINTEKSAFSKSKEKTDKDDLSI